MSQNIDLKKFNKHKIEKEGLIKGIAPQYDFPKYTTQIINIANQNSQATRPKVVGQMSELIKKCPYNSYEGWKNWYLEKYPDAIDKATDKAYDGVKNLQNASKFIDKNMVKNWITDLIITKTAEGLIYQEAILKYMADLNNTTYRLANPEEESKGIDGYVGEKPYQVKSTKYAAIQSHETFNCDIIYYEATGKYLMIYTTD